MLSTTCEWAKKLLDFFQALTNLETSRSLIQAIGPANPGLSLRLGYTHAYFGNQTEAVTVLKQGLSTQLMIDSESLLALELTNAIVEVYVQSGQWTKVVEMCEGALRRHDNLHENYEKYRLLFFCVMSHYKQNRKTADKGDSLIKKWTAKMEPDSLQSQAVLLCLKAIQLNIERKKNEAASRYLEALELDQTNQSYIVALARRRLAAIYRENSQWKLAEKTYKEAEETLGKRYFHTLEHAHCLYELGVVYNRTSRREEAIEKMREAQRLYRNWSDVQNAKTCETDLKSLLGV